MTLSLLLTACVEYICKCDSEYYLISFTQRPKSVTPAEPPDDNDNKPPGKKKREEITKRVNNSKYDDNDNAPLMINDGP